MYKFRLFISGFGSETSQSAMKQVYKALDTHLKDTYTLSIIDVIDDPNCARRNMIFATPVLIKRSPKPERRVFGNLSDSKEILESLGIDLTNEK